MPKSIAALLCAFFLVLGFGAGGYTRHKVMAPRIDAARVALLEERLENARFYRSVRTVVKDQTNENYDAFRFAAEQLQHNIVIHNDAFNFTEEERTKAHVNTNIPEEQ